MQLSEIIIRKIQDEGPISFRDFMEISLYYPGLGYYTSANDRIGPEGDYYTSPNLTPSFGAMIGLRLEKMWESTGKGEFTIVEYGAGTGKLCQDILESLKKNTELYGKLKYCIIEKSPSMREKEKACLHEKVSWHDGIQDISDIVGCVLSNELVDNFAIHQVVMTDELMEVFVDYKDGFVELLKPAPKELKDYLDELNVALPKGFRTEINIEATQWIKEVAMALKKGYVMTIDYGFPSSGLYTSQKSCGTLACYNKHTINENPYINIGNQDITTHVNFSALCHWGIKNGLACCGLTNQADFLLELGFKEHLRKMLMAENNPATAIRKEIFLSHALLSDMGIKFKVLIQQKGIVQREKII
jgi:SAM-dependent MidA family methyltransferase